MEEAEKVDDVAGEALAASAEQPEGENVEEKAAGTVLEVAEEAAAEELSPAPAVDGDSPEAATPDPTSEDVVEHSGSAENGPDGGAEGSREEDAIRDGSLEVLDSAPTAAPEPPPPTPPPPPAASGPIPGLSIRQYLDTTVVPVLRLGLRELVKSRPADPFDFLSDFIRNNKPS